MERGRQVNAQSIEKPPGIFARIGIVLDMIKFPHSIFALPFALLAALLSAAYMARYVAKNIVAAGIADSCQVAFAYAIGVEQPVSVQIDVSGPQSPDPEKISARVRDMFDLSPRGIIEHLGLFNFRYRQTARNGHFGNPDFPWESTSASASLKDLA
ncbi:MAG: methionine adenosyltransferase domain-containing protein [Armatimonadetes bacterium]|nr:methionine adenosyltransferase domain-containing protein [Armatimonadota bacterium]